MKKAFVSVFSVLLAMTLLLSSVPASAQALTDPHSEFVLNLWSEYVKECKEIIGYAPTISSDLSYKEISDYEPDSDDTSKNFKLVLATYGSTEDTYAYRNDFGEYTYYNPNSSGSREYLIYLYNQDLVYTVEQAYYNNVEGLESALRALNGEALLKNGDVNGDFEVNVKDATFLQKYLAQLERIDNIYSVELFERAADLNHDHKINVKDATLIQKQLAKIVIPTTYDSVPATVDSVEYTEVDLGNGADLGNSDRLITSASQWNAYPHNVSKSYTEEFFEDKAFIHIYRTYYSGMVEGFVDGVYKEGDTLYVKYREVHPPINVGVTCDIGVFNVALEIDKELSEGVTKLVVEKNSYNLPPYEG